MHFDIKMAGSGQVDRGAPYEQARFDFDTTTGHLLSFEMATRDGSSMRSDFTNVHVNQKIDRHVFEYDFTGYEIVDGKN